jgi:hypothetical protein
MKGGWRTGVPYQHHVHMLIREATTEDWSAIWPFFHAIVGAGETFTYPLDLSEEQGREWWL